MSQFKITCHKCFRKWVTATPDADWSAIRDHECVLPWVCDTCGERYPDDPDWPHEDGKTICGKQGAAENDNCMGIVRRAVPTPEQRVKP